MLRDLYVSEVENEDGKRRHTGYDEGVVYNFPTHIARALVKKGYAEFYHAPIKGN